MKPKLIKLKPFTKAIVKRVLGILKADCGIEGCYIEKANPKVTCAVGALALAAGVSPRVILRVNDKGIGGGDAPELEDGDTGKAYIPDDLGNIGKMQVAIYNKFRLSPDDLHVLQTANDNIGGKDAEAVRDRRRAVIAAFKERLKERKVALNLARLGKGLCPG